MAPVITDIQTPVPSSDLAVLEAHLPYSYSLLRRCQFTHRPHGHSKHAHYLFVSDPSVHPHHFAAAYVDLSKGPETETFLYSTLQDYHAEGDGIIDQEKVAEEEEEEEEEELVVNHVLDLLLCLFRRIKTIAGTMALIHPLNRPHGTMVGGFHQGTYQRLVSQRGVRSSYWNPHDVWLFRLDGLPSLPSSASATGGPNVAWSLSSSPPPPPPPPTTTTTMMMRWDVVRREDCALIASRTKIPKVADTLMSEPSVVVRVRHRSDGQGEGKKEEEEKKEETLVAWGFMGIAGTLSTLHIEEPYRGRGMAKAVAIKVLREHSFGDDGWGSADVHVDNIQSQGVCKSLGGKKGIRTCWTVIDYDSIS